MEMGDAALLRVNAGAAERRRGNILICHTFNDLGTCDEHLTDVVDDKNEIRDTRAVNGTARTVSCDNGNLGNVSGSHRIIIEDFSVSREGVDAFLNAGAAGIVDTDDGAAVFNRHFDGVCYFITVLFAESTADDGKILGVDHDFLSTDRAIAGDNAVVRELAFFYIKGIFQIRDV